jgi:hypothetical protein
MTYDILEFYETHQSKAATLGYVNIKYGMKMTMTTLNNFLTDTLLYGEYKGVPDYVEPYITKERFDRIQDILKRNARISSAKEGSSCAGISLRSTGVLICSRSGYRPLFLFSFAICVSFLPNRRIFTAFQYSIPRKNGNVKFFA